MGLHPDLIAVGVGFRRNCPEGRLDALLTEVLAEFGATFSRGYLATIAHKRESGHIEALAARHGLTPRYLSAEELAAQAVNQPSRRVADAVGTGSVAEAAALAALGPGATLLVPRRANHDATCALAVLNNERNKENS